jgi:hypothetical protein
MMGMNNSKRPWHSFSQSQLPILVVYLTPPDYEGPGTSPSLSTESLATISNLSSLEFEFFTSGILARDP